jgi:hypothetical protein
MNKLLESLDPTDEELQDAEVLRQAQLERLTEDIEASKASEAAAQEITATQEASFDASQVHDLAKTSLDFLGALAAPLVFKYCFPPVFLAVWNWLLDFVAKPRTFPQLALGLPRGFGKTTVIKLFVLYCILFTNKKFILIISHTASLAENIVHDIAAFLDEPNIKKIFGDWTLGRTKDTQDEKHFGFRGRNIVLKGIGAGSSLRGINVNNMRPDIMIFEDIQSREDADSEKISNDLETWMLGTAMKAKSPDGCMFLFIANMYPTKWSLLRKLKANPKWTKFIAGGILADGTSLWEELQPIEQLLSEFENDLAAGKAEIFYSEVLNDENAAANNLIDFTKLPPCDIQQGEPFAGNYVIIDPAGMKRKSDETAIGYFEVHAEKPVLMEVTSSKLSPADTIRQALKYCLTNNCRLVAIESVAYQATLAYWFGFICQQLGITGIECVEIYPGGFSKISRILAMFKMYQAGDILVNAPIRSQVHAQITSFNPLKDNNQDDILDLLVYAPKVLEAYPEFVVSNGLLVSQEMDALEVIEDNSCI